MYYSDIIPISCVWWDGSNAEEIKSVFYNDNILEATREDGVKLLIVNDMHVIEQDKYIASWADDGEMDTMPYDKEELMTKDEFIEAIKKELE